VRSRISLILATAVALGASANATHAQGRTHAQILNLVADQTGTYPEDSILATARRYCLGFVPTRERVNTYLQTRPVLSDTFGVALVNSCYTKVALDNLSDVRELLEHKSPDQVERIVQRSPCPSGTTYADLRAVALAGATRRTVEHFGNECDLDVRRSRFEISLKAGYAPMRAADEIRAQRMAFQGWGELSLDLAYAPTPPVRISVEFERTGYAYDDEGLDDQTDGTFTLSSVALSGRYYVSCLWSRCGEYLYSRGDAYVQIAGSWNALSGGIEVASTSNLPGGEAEMSFKGAGIGFEAGYTHRLRRSLGLTLEAGYTWISFDRLRIVDVTGEPQDDRVGGTTRRSRLGLSLAYLLPI
jgi:hypothetical protein